MVIRNDRVNRIIIWGTGINAIWWYRNFGKNYKGIVEVRGFTSTEREEDTLIEQNMPYFDKEEVAEMYKQQIIDGVFIAVSESIISDIEYYLAVIGVARLELGNPIFVDAYELADKKENICGVDFYYINEVSIRKEPEKAFPWVYTKEGKGIRDISNIVGQDPTKYGKPRVPFTNNKKEQWLKGEVCCLACQNNMNYSHFVLEVLPKIIMLESVGYSGNYVINDVGFIREWVAILGVDNRVILLTDNDEKIYMAETFIISEAINHNDKRMVSLLRIMVGELMKKDGFDKLTNKDFPKRLFVKRVGSRKVHGISGVLQEYGFTTMIPENYSVIEQIEFFANAEIVILPHGAAGANCLFMNSNTHLIECFGRQYIVPRFHIRIIQAKRIKYHMVVEDYPYRATDNRNPLADYYLNEDVLRAVIESCL